MLFSHNLAKNGNGNSKKCSDVLPSPHSTILQQKMSGERLFSLFPLHFGLSWSGYPEDEATT